jgi:hypothetical protein
MQQPSCHVTKNIGAVVLLFLVECCLLADAGVPREPSPLQRHHHHHHHHYLHCCIMMGGGRCCLLLQATEEISAFICPALVDSHGHTVLRLSMGRLLDTLLSNMDAVLKQQQQQQQQQRAGSSAIDSSQPVQLPKLMMYSGHDSTIMPLLTGALSHASTTSDQAYSSTLPKPPAALCCICTMLFPPDFADRSPVQQGSYTLHVCYCQPLAKQWAINYVPSNAVVLFHCMSFKRVEGIFNAAAAAAAIDAMACCCQRSALGMELDTWPPYISNLVFELWELTPPTVSPRSNMTAGSSPAAAAAAAPTSPPGPFFVRVLYNKQPLPLPGAAEGDKLLTAEGLMHPACATKWPLEIANHPPPPAPRIHSHSCQELKPAMCPARWAPVSAGGFKTAAVLSGCH